MCTVTYIPTKIGAIITSNRDENINRGTTLKPTSYYHNNAALIYPKDEKGSGTWIAKNENNCVAVLLNGAFEKHTPKQSYKQSRGFIIPLILQTNNPVETIDNIDFIGIEPFTIILYTASELFEYRWNTIKLFKKKVAVNKAHIWSSSTLYTTEIIEQREIDFLNWVNQFDDMNVKSILSFHHTKKYELELPSQSIINNIKTVSITQIQTMLDETKITYQDLNTMVLTTKK